MNATLQEIPIFHALSREQIAELSEWMRRVEYQPGETIFTEGSPAQELFVLARGRVEVVKESQGGMVPIAVLEAPSVFGEMGFLNSSDHSAAVRALTAATAGVLPIDLFEQRLAENNVTALRIALHIGRVACQRLRVTTDKLLQLAASCPPPPQPTNPQVSRHLTEICRRIFKEGSA